MKLTIKEVAGYVKHYAGVLATYNPKDIGADDGYANGEIRLQIHDGEWTIWQGDACYDTDHRGYWGFALVPAGASMKACREIARELISEALDDMASVMIEADTLGNKTPSWMTKLVNS